MWFKTHKKGRPDETGRLIRDLQDKTEAREPRWHIWTPAKHAQQARKTGSWDARCNHATNLTIMVELQTANWLRCAPAVMAVAVAARPRRAAAITVNPFGNL